RACGPARVAPRAPGARGRDPRFGARRRGPHRALGPRPRRRVRGGRRAGVWAGACVVVGGRAAVWAPVPDLCAVVVVDEGDEALEDERAPTWNARDVAVERARRAGAAVRVLTPAAAVDATRAAV